MLIRDIGHTVPVFLSSQLCINIIGLGIVTTTTGMEVVMENTKVGFPKIAEKLVVFAKTRKNDWA